MESRTILLTKQKELLSGKGHTNNLWDQFVRKILSFFPNFEALNISQLIEIGDMKALVGTNVDTLIAYYQSYQ